MKPDPAAELAAIRRDIEYLTRRAMACQDIKALRRLQTSLTRWIHQHAEKEQEQ